MRWKGLELLANVTGARQDTRHIGHRTGLTVVRCRALDAPPRWGCAPGTHSWLPGAHHRQESPNSARRPNSEARGPGPALVARPGRWRSGLSVRCAGPGVERPASVVQRLDVLVDPVQGALDGLLPQAQQPLPGLLVHGGLPALVLGPVVDDVLLALPEADGDAGGVGGTERGGLDDLRSHHGNAQDVGR